MRTTERRSWRTLHPFVTDSLIVVCARCAAFLCATQPYSGIDRNDWFEVSVGQPDELAAAVGPWPPQYGRDLKAVRQTKVDRATAHKATVAARR